MSCSGSRQRLPNYKTSGIITDHPRLLPHGACYTAWCKCLPCSVQRQRVHWRVALMPAFPFTLRHWILCALQLSKVTINLTHAWGPYSPAWGIPGSLVRAKPATVQFNADSLQNTYILQQVVMFLKPVYLGWSGFLLLSSYPCAWSWLDLQWCSCILGSNSSTPGFPWEWGITASRSEGARTHQIRLHLDWGPSCVRNVGGRSPPHPASARSGEPCVVLVGGTPQGYEPR